MQLQREKNSLIIILTITCLIAISFAITYLIYQSVTYLFIIIILILFLLFSVCLIIKLGLEFYLLLLLFLFMSFNIEVILTPNTHFGGLPGGFGVNQFLILTFLYFVFFMLRPKKNIFSSDIPNVNVTKTIEMKYYYLFVFTGTFSIFFADNIIASTYLFTRYITSIALIYSLIRADLRKIWIVATFGLGISVLLQLLIGLAQMITGENIGLKMLGENSEPFRKGVETIERGISGTLGHPSTLAMFTLLIGFWGLGLLDERNSLKKIHKASLLTIMVLSTFTIILTNARTSIIILVIMGAIFIVTKLYIDNKFELNKIKVPIFLKVIFIFIFIIISASSIYYLTQERFVSSDFIRQFNDRLNLTMFSFEIINHNFSNNLFGVGLNNYVDELSKYGSGQFKYIHPVHNYFLLLWAEGGLFHSLFYLLLNISIMVKMIEVIRNGDKGLAYKALVINLGLGSIFIYNLSDWAMSHNQMFYIFIVYFTVSLKIFSEYLEFKSRKKAINESLDVS